MRWVDVDRVHSGHGAPAGIIGAAEDKGVQEAALLQIETVHLVSGRTEERVAAGKMVSERTAKARYSCAVVKAALRVQLDSAVGLQMERLCPVV
jgi:hypothetical protein